MIERKALSREHAGILEMAHHILDHVAVAEFDAPAVIKLRWRLAHALAVHLAKEDNIIYPRLKRHPDPRIARLAIIYENEMGNLSSQYQAYMTRWTGGGIALDRETFVAETRRVLGLLARRVDREELELYPMYEESSRDDDAPAANLIRPFARYV